MVFVFQPTWLTSPLPDPSFPLSEVSLWGSLVHSIILVTQPFLTTWDSVSPTYSPSVTGMLSPWLRCLEERSETVGMLAT